MTALTELEQGGLLGMASAALLLALMKARKLFKSLCRVPIPFFLYRFRTFQYACISSTNRSPPVSPGPGDLADSVRVLHAWFFVNDPYPACPAGAPSLP